MDTYLIIVFLACLIIATIADGPDGYLDKNVAISLGALILLVAVVLAIFEPGAPRALSDAAPKLVYGFLAACAGTIIGTFVKVKMLRKG